MLNKTKRILFISLCVLAFAIFSICLRTIVQQLNPKNYISGALIKKASSDTALSQTSGSLSRQAIAIINESMNNQNEKYFRPSKLKTLNNKYMKPQDFTNTFSNGTVPDSLQDNTYNTVINYFSILQQASNLKESQIGGCGTIGFEKAPYPIAYKLLSENYKKMMPYDDYVKSFEGIGHINLIKAIPIVSKDTNVYKYFIELEILEGTDIGVTTFNYYTGDMALIKVNDLYYIDYYSLTFEDFFCAAYHGWAFNAEAYVETVYGNWCGLIMKQYSPEQDNYKKSIIVDGIDNKKYMFEFAKLTNGTDLLINTLVNSGGHWIPVEINVDKCLENNVKK